MTTKSGSGLLNKLIEGWTGGTRSMPAASAMARNRAQVFPDYGSMGLVGNQLSAYAASAIVHTAVQVVAEECAGVPFHVFYQGRDQAQRLSNHKFSELLDHPNAITSGFDLIESTVQWLELAGNAYWFYEPDERGAPAEIWPLRPDRMAIIPDERDLIWGYLYDYNGTQVRIPAVQITHFKRPHPFNDWFGLSAMQAASLEIASDREMAKFTHQFFGRKVARMDGILILPAMLSDEKFTEAKEMIEASYGNQRATAILRAGMEGGDSRIEWHETSMRQRDMEFTTGRGYVRQVVLELLGIPTGMMSEASTEAHARVSERRFLHRIYKRHLRMSNRLTIDALPLYGHRLKGLFEDVRVADAEQLAAKLQAMGPYITVNEAREQFGLEPTDEQVGRHPDGTEGERQDGDDELRVFDELGSFKRFALRRDGLGLDRFRPKALGKETFSELVAACEGADQEVINAKILELRARQENELVR